MFKNLIAAAAMSVAALAMAGTANALTSLTTNGPLDGVVGVIAVPNVFTIEIGGNAVDIGGSYSFGFLAATNLLSVETNSLNPVDDGFADALVQWSTLINGTGTVLGTISGAALSAGSQLLLPMVAGQTYWLTASWSDVVEDGSNFDLRVKAKPDLTPDPVPVPLPILLLGTALLGLGALGRRRKAAA